MSFAPRLWLTGWQAWRFGLLTSHLAWAASSQAA